MIDFATASPKRLARAAAIGRARMDARNIAAHLRGAELDEPGFVARIAAMSPDDQAAYIWDEVYVGVSGVSVEVDAVGRYVGVPAWLGEVRCAVIWEKIQ